MNEIPTTSTEELWRLALCLLLWITCWSLSILNENQIWRGEGLICLRTRGPVQLGIFYRYARKGCPHRGSETAKTSFPCLEFFPRNRTCCVAGTASETW